MNIATACQRLEQIEAILADGVSTVTRAGRTITYDLGQLQIERTRLQRLINGNGKVLRIRPGYYGRRR